MNLIKPQLLLVAAAALVFSCTVKKERSPGPLVVWLYTEPGSEHYYRLLADEYRRDSGVELELVLKEPHEIRALLLNRPEQLKDKVNLVEVDLFDLEPVARYMEDLRPLLAENGNSFFLHGNVLKSGEFNGRQKFLAWRLSWPAMVISNDIKVAPQSWKQFKQLAEQYSGEVVVPGLDDREVFAFVMSVVWAHQADPTKPFDKNLSKAFQYLADLSEHLSYDSGALKSSEIAQLASQARPKLFITWPQGIIPLIMDGSLALELNPEPLPCGHGRNCAIFFMGRFIGVPKGAAHPDDAQNFIRFMLSAKFQRQLVFAQPWLPAHSRGWGDLGPRQNGYGALIARAREVRLPPDNLALVERELTKAGRMLLYEGAGPWDTLNKYRDALLEE